jgi:hypothetical protein
MLLNANGWLNALEVEQQSSYKNESLLPYDPRTLL